MLQNLKTTYRHHSVKRQGKKDGRDWEWTIWPFRKEKSPRPAPDQEFASYWQNLKEAAEHDIHNVLVPSWREEDSRLKQEYCAALAEYNQARAELERERPEAEEARKGLEKAREEFLNVDPPTLNRKWAHFWLAIIGIGELFFNSTVFQILGQGRLETYLAALAVAAGIPLAGHLVGQVLKQIRKTRTDWAMIVAVPAGVIGGLYGLSLLRAEYFEVSQVNEILGLQLTPGEFTLMFLLLNILLLFVAILISYASSHPYPQEYQRLRKKYQSSREILEKEGGEAQSALRRYEKAEKRLHRARQGRIKHYQEYRDRLQGKIEAAEMFSHVYRSANLRARPDGAVPLCFKEDPPVSNLKMPEAFAKPRPQDWDCGPEVQAPPVGSLSGKDDEPFGDTGSQA